MPISFEGQQFEFQDLVTHLKTTRKDIENPEGFVGSLEKEQGVALSERFFEDDEGKWGKFFLISPDRNVNKWRVTKNSIPKRIQTFVNRPFISEPNLEHFGAENMKSPLEIIQKQDEFRMGIIKKVVFDEKTLEGDALVLFDKNPKAERVWSDLKSGNAFYVSPAIAGEFVEVNGERIYQDWFGLHLARVANPAYGVFHASLKATCEGDEKKCIQNLIATAAVMLESNDTFNFTGFSCAKNMTTENDPDTPFEETEAGKAISGVAADLKTLTDKVKKVETSFEQIPNKTKDPSPKGQTTPVKDSSSDGTQSQAALHGNVKEETGADEPKKLDPETAAEFDKLKKIAEAADDDLRERLTEDVLETESAEMDLMGETRTAADEDTRKAELKEMDTASLKTASVAAIASLEKMTSLAAKLGKTSVATNFTKTRLIRTPGQGVATASSTGYKNSKDIKSGWAN